MVNPFISIIIPLYNVRDYVTDCLKSVVSQTYKGPIECLIIDDCGTDDSIYLVEDFLKYYSGPILFQLLRHKKNRGLSAARNTGIKASQGDYLFFLDSDDEITPDCIESLATPLAEKEYDFVVGDYKVTGTDIQFQKLNMKTGETRFGSKVTKSYVKKEWMQVAWNKLYNRSYILRANLSFKEGLIHEDELWSFQIACTAQSISAVKKETYIYKVRTNSITTANTAKRKADALITIVSEEQLFLKERNLRRNYWCFQLYQRYFCIALLSSLEYSLSLFYQNYEFLQRHNVFSKMDVIWANHFRLKNLLRDSHFFLPTRIGTWVFLRIIRNKLSTK